MNHQYHGSCECGEVKLTLTLNQPIETLTPRKCDCDFCMARNICYLSAPDATIEVTTKHALTAQQQGSMQAEFLTCPQCQTLIGATCEFGDIRKGALNARILADQDKLQPAVIASPKQLSPQEKFDRWKILWANWNETEDLEV